MEKFVRMRKEGLSLMEIPAIIWGATKALHLKADTYPPCAIVNTCTTYFLKSLGHHNLSTRDVNVFALDGWAPPR